MADDLAPGCYDTHVAGAPAAVRTHEQIEESYEPTGNHVSFDISGDTVSLDGRFTAADLHEILLALT